MWGFLVEPKKTPTYPFCHGDSQDPKRILYFDLLDIITPILVNYEWIFRSGTKEGLVKNAETQVEIGKVNLKVLP